jgi:hypothetical protein
VMDSSGVHANFSHHRVSPDLSAMASPTLVVDPYDTARRVEEQPTGCMAWQPTGLLCVLLYVLYCYVVNV